MKTSELTGAALDWAVAECEGGEGGYYRQIPYYQPSTDWSQGGPIIGRELIDIMAMRDEDAWLATTPDDGNNGCQEEIAAKGPTPLIAAMRCYVASRLGDEVRSRRN